MFYYHLRSKFISITKKRVVSILLRKSYYIYNCNTCSQIHEDILITMFNIQWRYKNIIACLLSCQHSQRQCFIPSHFHLWWLRINIYFNPSTTHIYVARQLISLYYRPLIIFELNLCFYSNNNTYKYFFMTFMLSIMRV